MRAYNDPINNIASDEGGNKYTAGPPSSGADVAWLEALREEIEGMIFDQHGSLDPQNARQLRDTVKALAAGAAEQSRAALSTGDDLNVLADGWYGWAGGEPTNAPFNYGVLVQVTDGSQKTQLCFGDSAYGKMAVRRADSGTFYAWTEFYSTESFPAATTQETRDGAAGKFPDASNIMIIKQDTLRQSVEAQTGGRQTIIYDAAGRPNWMYVLPRFRYEDLGYTTELGTGDVSAFVVNGVVKPEIFIGAYQADGNGCSTPYANVQETVDYDQSVAQCTAKGAGWHLMTAHEWAAVAFWCMANGYQPRGNTDYGRAHDSTHEHGRRQDGSFPGDTAGAAGGNIRAGSGPKEWRHTGDLSGIADLVGNIWEWQHGLKLVNGEIFAMTDNYYDQAEASWPSAGKYVSAASGIELTEAAPTVDNTSSADFGAVTTATGYTSSQLLRRLLVEPAGIIPQGRFYARDFGERLPLRGGSRNNGGNAGLSALLLSSERSARSSLLGCRPAFVS